MLKRQYSKGIGQLSLNKSLAGELPFNCIETTDVAYINYNPKTYDCY